MRCQEESEAERRKFLSARSNLALHDPNFTPPRPEIFALEDRSAPKLII
jgi:hypothetical protein